MRFQATDFETETCAADRALRFGRAAVSPGLCGQRFGALVAWPLLQQYAKREGFQAFYCESHLVEKLFKYYTETLGMIPCGIRTYHDRHHPTEVTAHRYLYPLPAV